MKNNLSWRHHYIPQFYLKGFVNDKNTFAIFDKHTNKIKEGEISFSLFPNPSSTHFTLEFEGEIKNLNYSIHDILGKEILSGKINSSQTKIDCANWSEGVYLIKVGDENGYSVKKLVVEK